MDPELTAELLAKARAKVKAMREGGESDSDIDAYLKAEIGAGLKEVMDPKVGDYARAASMGATFGFLDELAGAGAALVPGGKDYAGARDAVRERAELARFAAPKRMMAAEIGGAAIPALATFGLTAPASGAGVGARALHASNIGLLSGAASGLGYSDSPTVGGMLMDAGDASALGAGGGLLFGGGAAAMPKARAQRAVMQEVQSLLPDDFAARAARQEALAPGTYAMIDEVPEMARIVGQSRDAARTAVRETSDRVRALDRARQKVGERYNAIDAKIPVDDEIRSIVGSRLQLGDEVDFKTLHSLRSDVGRRLNDARKAYKLRQERGDEIAELAPVKEGLDRWMRQRVEGLESIDNDYSAVLDMLKGARQSEKMARQSQKAHGVTRASGLVPTSVGSTLAQRPSIRDFVAKLVSPSPKKRAQVVEELLMRPGQSQQKTLGLLQAELPGAVSGASSGPALNLSPRIGAVGDIGRLKDPERIVASVIRSRKDNRIIGRGNSHLSAQEEAIERGLISDPDRMTPEEMRRYLNDYEDGFETSHRPFVDRLEAARIAVGARQNRTPEDWGVPPGAPRGYGPLDSEEVLGTRGYGIPSSHLKNRPGFLDLSGQAQIASPAQLLERSLLFGSGHPSIRSLIEQ